MSSPSVPLPSEEKNNNNNNDGLAGYMFFTDSQSSFSYQYSIPDSVSTQPSANTSKSGETFLLTAAANETGQPDTPKLQAATNCLESAMSTVSDCIALTKKCNESNQLQRQPGPPEASLPTGRVEVFQPDPPRSDTPASNTSNNTIDLLNGYATQENQSATHQQTESGSVVTFEPGQELPSSICDVTGKKAQFAYDVFGKLCSLSERSAERWLRMGDPDENGAALWVSSDGREQRAAITVFADGSYQTNIDGTITKISDCGEISVQYSQTQAKERVSLLVKMFERVDTNGDTRLSKTELEAATRLTDLTAKELEILNTLRTTYAAIEWTKRGMFGLEERGVSLSEILEFRSDKQASASSRFPESAVKLAEKAFDCCDELKSGFVTLSQIAAAARLRSVDTTIKGVLQRMSTRLTGLAYLSTYGCNIDLKLDRSQFREVFMCMGDLPHCKEDADTLTPETNLYANPSERLSSISMRAVGNGTAGDGIFLSILAALVRNMPHAILNMIRPMDDGSFVVTFPGDATHPVRVMPPALPELRHYGKADEFGVWALIMEKAYDLYFSQRESWFAQGTPPLALESAHDIIELLTGQPGNWHALEDVENSELDEFLNKMTRERRLICLASWKHNSFSNAGIWNHAYSLIEYDSEGKVLTLRNAYGRCWQSAAGETVIHEDVKKVALTDVSGLFDVLLFEARWA